MNRTENRTLEIQIPKDRAGKDFIDLITNQTMHLARSLTIAPNTTIILYPTNTANQ